MSSFDDISIISMGQNIPAPYACEKLSKMGIPVLKVESVSGDLVDRFFPDWYEKMHEEQTVIKLNLKDNSDKNKLYSKLENANVFITSSLPQSLKAMGLDWETLHEKFPKLNVIQIFGDLTQPEIPGHDNLYQAELGLINPPNTPKVLWTDLVTANEVVIKCMELILKNIVGELVKVGMKESLGEYLHGWNVGATQSPGILSGDWAPYSFYECKEGWIALAAFEEKYQNILKEKLELVEINKETLQEKFKLKTATEWQRWAESNLIPLKEIKDGL